MERPTSLRGPANSSRPAAERAPASAPRSQRAGNFSTRLWRPAVFACISKLTGCLDVGQPAGFLQRIFQGDTVTQETGSVWQAGELVQRGVPSIMPMDAP